MSQSAYAHDYLGRHVYNRADNKVALNHEFVLNLCSHMTIDELENLIFQMDVMLGKKRGEKENGRTT